MTNAGEVVSETAGPLEFLVPDELRDEPRGGEHQSLQARKTTVGWMVYGPDQYIYRLKVILHPEEEGGYSVWAESLPGAISQGETEAEALDMIKDAILETIRAHRDLDEPIPWKEPEANPGESELVRWVVVNA